MNNNMINPANYYNPFAKYNYVSKTRGAYVPQGPETQNLWDGSSKVRSVSNSTNIWSEDYDASNDIDKMLGNSSNTDKGIISLLGNLFGKKTEDSQN